MINGLKQKNIPLLKVENMTHLEEATTSFEAATNVTTLAKRKGKPTTITSSNKDTWEGEEDHKEKYDHEVMAHALWHNSVRTQGRACDHFMFHKKEVVS